MYVQRPRLLAGAALAAQTLGLAHEAHTYLEEAHRYTEMRGLKFFEPLVQLIDGRVSAMRGEEDRALERYTRSEGLAQQMGMHPIIWQARLGRAGVLRERGEQAAAHAEVEGAERTVSEMADAFTNEANRKAFRESMAEKIAAIA
jgi:ATP/maltotriose-dependent transcriptional regulator MalT